MSLSNKLKETMEELEKAKIVGLENQHNASVDAIKRERQQTKQWLDSIKDTLISQINEGKIPLKKIKSYEKKSWVKKCFLGNAEHQDIWNDFQSFWRSEGLYIIYEEGYDGMGMEEWINLSLKVLPPRMRPPEFNQTNRHGLKGDLSVGDYRG
jgi:hypothetical protein